MARTLILIFLFIACLGTVAVDAAARLLWFGPVWMFHDDTYMDIKPAERVYLSLADPGWLDFAYEELVERPPQAYRFDGFVIDVWTYHFSLEYKTDAWKKEHWRSFHVAVPLWVIAVLLGTWPVVAFIQGPCRRRARRKRGLCPYCGYDLTGNLSGVCPECGANLPKPPRPPGDSALPDS